MMSTLALVTGLLLTTLAPEEVQVAPPLAAEGLYSPGMLAAGAPSLRPLAQEATGASTPSAVGAQRAYTPLSLTTAGSLLLTGALGTLVSLNRGTVFHRGLCEGGGASPLFGASYGCGPLSIVHGVSAVLSVTLYTATTVVGAFAGEPPLGQGRERGLFHRALSWVALVGLALQPLLGIVSAYPEILGVPATAQEDFRRVGRTVHVGIGYVAIASYLTTVVLHF